MAKSHILDLDGLNKFSKEHQNNPIIGYLNIIVCAIKLMIQEKFVEKHKYTYYPLTKLPGIWINWS